ncbi:aldolase [Lentithecium fluviatile CBS 122367]|uniref:Aldolase n=1 Tax=Lentithecium fluviatile CBS 122367 TaxID=1168545 RepID=A0A6G1J4A7_9PLEO|nr:aldolase [Lentithecium fluviatile CBS 122367]
MVSIPGLHRRAIVPGVYCPTQCFFDPVTEDLDLDSVAKHAVRLAQAGIVGITTNGSNGEAPYLSRNERKLVTSTTRSALDKARFNSTPIIVGASAESVRGTLQLCRDAEESGGDAVLILVPSFFKWAMNAGTIKSYLWQVADQSPLPIIIYNYPGAVAGIDIDSDLLTTLAQHPNIVGTKFTCGNVGKVARVAAAAKASTAEGRTEGEYYCFSGVADLIAPALAVGACGAIVGAANVFPKTCVELFDLCVEGGDGRKIRDLQALLAEGDWAMTKRAIPGFKAVLDKYHGYGGVPRQPMPTLDQAAKDELYAEVAKIMKHEATLK